MEQQKCEKVRKLVAAALCDLIGVLDGVKDPFIVGGQYPRERLLAEFRSWLQDRHFNVAGATGASAQWMSLCNMKAFSGLEDEPRSPLDRGPPPEPKPKPPKPGTTGKPPTPPPAGDDDEDEDDGYLKGDHWKPKEDRKDNWQDEGEDWKKGKEDD